VRIFDICHSLSLPLFCCMTPAPLLRENPTHFLFFLSLSILSGFLGTGPSSTSGYRRVGQATGPGSSHTTYTPTQDSGKFVPSGQVSGGYRATNQATGPGSSHTTYTPTQDSGKFLPSGQVSGGYRATNQATGPGSSHAEYVPTEDSGKYLPSGQVVKGSGSSSSVHEEQPAEHHD
jgi:hypothetical protein